VIDGRVYFDSYSINQSGSETASLSTLQDYNGIRDLRIGVKGEGYDILDYKVDLCLIERTGNGNNGVNLKDVWLGIKNVPLLEYVKIGHYRIEEGVSVLTGGTNTTFLEFDGRDFATGRRIGISSRHLWARDQIRFFAGFFYNNNIATPERYQIRDDQGSITNLRLTFLTHASRKDGKIDGKRFLLFGGNYSYFDTTKTGLVHGNASFTERFATVDQMTLASYSVPTNGYHKFGLEFASQNGPLSVQSEAYVNQYNSVNINGVTKDRTIFGSYVTVRYFLTGDYRKFSADSAVWGAADLKHNLDLKKVGDHNFAEWLGGWEIAAKWGYTETSQLFGLRDSDKNYLFAGSVNDFTLGLNWYWSPQARWLFNYIHAVPSQIRDRQSRDHSDTDIFAASFRYNF
jgi:phosphate-selective porin OprO/OprP